MDEFIKKFIEENLENYIEDNQEYIQQVVKSVINNKVSYRVQQYFDGKIKGVEDSLNEYIESQISERVEKIPTRTSEKFELIIEKRVLDKLSKVNSGKIKEMFQTREGPNETSVISYLESIIHKNLNKSLNSHIEKIGSTYIKKLSVLNVEDVENEIADLENQAKYAEKCAYEAGQMQMAKEIRNSI